MTQEQIDELVAQNEMMRAALSDIDLRAVQAYHMARSFIDDNVPDWVRGDDGPVFPVMRISTKAKEVLAAPLPAAVQLQRAARELAEACMAHEHGPVSKSEVEAHNIYDRYITAQEAYGVLRDQLAGKATS